MLENHELLHCHGTVSESWQPHFRNTRRSPELKEMLKRDFPTMFEYPNRYKRNAVRPEVVPTGKLILQKLG